MELVELVPLRGLLVGTPGGAGLSVEQRKRLSIAVELVANPSLVLMDEPTTGAGKCHRLRCTCLHACMRLRTFKKTGQRHDHACSTARGHQERE